MNDLIKKEVENYLIKFPGCVCSLKQHFKNFKIDMYNFIMDYTKILNEKYTFSHRLFWVINKITDFPKCKLCGKPNKRVIKKFNEGYNGTLQYCCHKCCVNSKECLEARINTNMERFGTKTPCENKEIQNKVEKTCLDRYGSKCYTSSVDGKEKIKHINLERFGVDTYSKSNQFKKIMSDVWKNRSNLEKDIIYKKSSQTKLERYGDPNYNNKKPKIKVKKQKSNPEDIKNKTKKTNLERYGVEYVMCNPTILQKSRETQLKKYGCLYTQTEEFKKRLIECNRKKYNRDWGLQSTIIRDKCKQTLIDKFGVDNYFKDSDFKQKIIIKKLNKTYDRLCTNTSIIPLFTREEFLSDPFSKEFKWKCLHCNSIITSKRSTSRKCEDSLYVRCWNCYPNKGLSVAEKDIFNLVYNYCNDVKETVRNIIPNKELDIYIPSKKLAIEYNGLYWHNNTMLRGDTKYHLNKTELCENKGIQLIHIFEDEYDYKKDIVLSRIKNLIGVYDNIVYARKCIIKEIDSKIKNNFLYNNHIQGSCNSKYNYGLYYDNELISIMTFGNLRIALGSKSKENTYELLRFCNKLGYHIPGAASKLFKYFIKIINPNKIISYADRRWSKGNLYYKLGFNLIRKTDPNYWYIINGKREHRFGWRKNILKDKLEKFDENKTEYQNMLDNGYDCVYDCGNYLFEWVR